eukprot:5425109-Prymnesium_polylepis.1
MGLIATAAQKRAVRRAVLPGTPTGSREGHTCCTLNDTHATYTATTDRPAGTVLTASDFDGSIVFQGFADQLIVYRGTFESPTFLCALDNSGGFDGCANGGSWRQTHCAWPQGRHEWYSALPPGLTSGVDALALPHKSYWAYTGATTGTPTELSAALAQISHWA